MYSIKFDKAIEKTIVAWKKSNPNSHKKLLKTLIAIGENPRQGIGHPEALVGSNNNIYSRRITAHDRIIYSINDAEQVVVIATIKGHYEDK